MPWDGNYTSNGCTRTPLSEQGPNQPPLSGPGNQPCSSWVPDFLTLRSDGTWTVTGWDNDSGTYAAITLSDGTTYLVDTTNDYWRNWSCMVAAAVGEPISNVEQAMSGPDRTKYQGECGFGFVSKAGDLYQGGFSLEELADVWHRT